MVTGEGSLDAQSLRGKAPVGVAAADGPPACRSSRSVVASRSTTPSEAAGIRAAYALLDLEPDPGSACASRCRCWSGSGDA